MRAGWWIAGGLAALLLVGGGAVVVRRAFMQAIEREEGRRNRAYKDTAGRWTIGVGHKVLPGEMTKYVGAVVSIRGQPRGSIVISEAEIDRLFAQDTAIADAAINRIVKAPLTANQRDALRSFVFNVGQGNFQTSTMARLLNQKNYAAAALEFPRWNKETKPDGTVVENAGLLARRLREQAIFRGTA